MEAVLARLEAVEMRDSERERQVQAMQRSVAALELRNARLEATGRALRQAGVAADPAAAPAVAGGAAVLGLPELPEEVLLGVCIFLRARDLGCLGCVSRRFAFRSGSADRGCGASSTGDAFDPGRGGSALGGGLQRAGAWVGAVEWS